MKGRPYGSRSLKCLHSGSFQKEFADLWPVVIVAISFPQGMNGLRIIKHKTSSWVYRKSAEGFLGKVSSSSQGNTGKDNFFLTVSLLHLKEGPGAVAALLCP